MSFFTVECISSSEGDAGGDAKMCVMKWINEDHWQMHSESGYDMIMDCVFIFVGATDEDDFDMIECDHILDDPTPEQIKSALDVDALHVYGKR